MRLLLFSDLHASKTYLEAIVSKAKDADILIGAGDFAVSHSGLGDSIDILKQIDKPAVLVPGNNETFDELHRACKVWSSAYVLHGTSVNVSGITFFGIGGGIPATPFGSWSYDFTEKQVEQLLISCPSRSVLIMHSPPFGTVDTTSSLRHLGSTALRDAIVRLEPKLVVCGHIHASCGQTEMLGITPVVNAGPYGMLWNLDN